MLWYSARFDWRYLGTLVGCRGQREQTMVGPHQGATLNLAAVAGHVGASKIPALVAISVPLLLLPLTLHCTMNE